MGDRSAPRRLKIHILNLGHTVMAELWRTERLPQELTVREIMADGGRKAFLAEIYEREVLPGFQAKGLGDEAKKYLATTLDRFSNPFLDHRLADIAANHRQKVLTRIGAFMEWTGMPASSMPRLGAICAANRGAV
jgi:tagaturonate reductase